MALVYIIKPELYGPFFAGSNFSLIFTLLLYFPAFLILMGLIEVWMPASFIIHHLGKHSGFKGSFYSFAIGSIMPGPLYVAFPLAAVLLKKGISMFNIALFIGAWSCFKLGEEIFELQFLGAKFMFLRILISIPFIILSAYVIDKVHFKEKKARARTS